MQSRLESAVRRVRVELHPDPEVLDERMVSDVGGAIKMTRTTFLVEDNMLMQQRKEARGGSERSK